MAIMSAVQKREFEEFLRSYGWRWHPGGYWVSPVSGISGGIYVTLESALKRLAAEARARVEIDNLGMGGEDGSLEEFGVGLWMATVGSDSDSDKDYDLSDYFTRPGLEWKDAEQYAKWLANCLGCEWAYSGVEI